MVKVEGEFWVFKGVVPSLVCELQVIAVIH